VKAAARVGRTVVAVGSAVVARPDLWATAVVLGARMARRHWWRRAPFLPVPGASYLAFRLETQYGRHSASAQGHDVVNYLAWCRQMNRLR
jgi:hypothetical protein